MTKEYVYLYKEQSYPVLVTYKANHCISYHFRDGKFVIYCPYLTSKARIFQGLDKFAVKLVDENPHVLGRGEGFIYLLGVKVPLKESGDILFGDGSIITYKNHADLDKKLRSWFLALLTRRNRHYEEEMHLPINHVRVRNMSTRYGSNSVSNRSITYSLILMHYSLDVIDAIIIHELAHCLVSGHSKKFYNVVYSYCPNYDQLHLRLRRGIFHD